MRSNIDRVICFVLSAAIALILPAWAVASDAAATRPSMANPTTKPAWPARPPRGTIYTATLDRKPVDGFATCNWWPGYFSPGDGTRVLDAAYARKWAADVAKLPPGGLAMLDFESIACERDARFGPIDFAPGEARDEFILAAARMSRDAIAAQPGGATRPIAIFGIWDYPVWFNANADVWLRRGPHLSRERNKRIASLKPLIDVTGCVTVGAYIGRAKGDPDFPAGEVERDLMCLAQQVEIYRAEIARDVPIYVFLWGRAVARPAELKLSEAECRRIAQHVRELDLIPIVWGDAAKDNDVLLRVLKDEMSK